MNQGGSHAVLVGAGQAGLVMAATLRSEGFPGRITLLGGEARLPYQRPPLSKSVLLGSTGPDNLALRPLSFFAEHSIDLRLGVRVEAVHPAAARLDLSDGSSMAYDLLGLATGAVPRRLSSQVGASLEGVLTLRNVDDAICLSTQLSSARSIVVIGGGYLGLEVAATSIERGLSVTVVEAAPRILQRVAAQQTSDVMRRLHVERGVTILESCQIVEIVGDTRVRAVRLGDRREVPADVIVVAIGVLPDIRLAQEAGLAIDNGVCVDPTMLTSAANIWAAGDCAAFEHRGRRLRIESVGNAIDTAEVAARNMLGRNEPYAPLPWFWSDQYDHRLQIAGYNQGHDNVHTRGGGAGVSHWYYRGDEFLAVDAIDDSRAYMVGKRLLEMGRSPSPSLVRDPATELKSLLRG